MKEKEIGVNKVYESMDEIENNSSKNIKFNKPYEFEGETYNEIDLSEVENISGNDMMKADRLFSKLGFFSPTPEMTQEYACIMASIKTKKPLEFFNNLKGNEIMKIKNVIMGFLFN